MGRVTVPPAAPDPNVPPQGPASPAPVPAPSRSLRANTLIVMAGTLGSRLSGIVRQIVINRFDDTLTDAFNVAVNVPNLLRNSCIATGLMARLRPTLVVSTGAAVAFPFFVLAKAMGVPTVYLEVFDRVDSRTLTGRLCHPLATEFLVQWEQQRELYSRARVIGTLL